MSCGSILQNKLMIFIEKTNMLFFPSRKKRIKIKFHFCKIVSNQLEDKHEQNAIYKILRTRQFDEWRSLRQSAYIVRI
jgi:hypothetical protein